MSIKEGFTLTDAFAAVSRVYDVLVIGGGIAGLCAALAAREQGASVALLEKTGESAGGGDSRHVSRMLLPGKGFSVDDCAESFSRPIRTMNGTELSATAPYAAALAHQAAGLAAWLQARGVALPTADSCLPGGGKALMNALYAAAEDAGIACARNAAVSRLELRNGQLCGVSFPLNGAEQQVRAKSVVVACGGVTERPGALPLRGGAANDGAAARLLETLSGCGTPRMLGARNIARYTPVDARAPETDGGAAVTPGEAFFHKATFVDRNGSPLPLPPDASGIAPSLYWGASLAALLDGKATALLAAPDAASIPLYFPPLPADSSIDSMPDAHTPAATEEEGAAVRSCMIPLVAALDSVVYGPALDEEGRPVFDGGPSPSGLFAAGEAVFANIPYVALSGPDNGLTVTAAALSGLLAGRSAAKAACAAAISEQQNQTAEVSHAG
ncbi:FAD-dependent oxidoreductase [Desulfovibrio sp. OttesenSCG-928-I05]|nr:FAD-dependent oxidoreductase [Desulfovibrio sp. OttesenSCG-928-I05]